MAMLEHNPKNDGQSPEFQTQGQLAEKEYPTANDLYYGINRVKGLEMPTTEEMWEEGRQ